MVDFVAQLAPNAETEHWAWKLGVCDIISIVSIVIGLVSLYVAYVQYRKALSSEEAVQKYKKQLYRQRAAQRFSEIAPKAVTLANEIRSKGWDSSAARVVEIAAALGNAEGFCAALIRGNERQDLEVAANAVKYIAENIPLDAAQPEGEVVRQMGTQCFVILYSINQIAGRLKSEDVVESQDDEPSESAD